MRSPEKAMSVMPNTREYPSCSHTLQILPIFHFFESVTEVPYCIQPVKELCISGT